MGLFIGRKGVDISQAQWSEALNNPFGGSLATNCQSKDGNKSQTARVLLQSCNTITIIWIKLRLDLKGQASTW